MAQDDQKPAFGQFVEVFLRKEDGSIDMDPRTRVRGQVCGFFDTEFFGAVQVMVQLEDGTILQASYDCLKILKS